MAISKFILPTGLDVSGSTTLTGTLDATGLVNVTTLTASVGISASVGRFGDLNVASLTAPSLNLEGDLTVSGNVNLGDGIGANIVTVRDALTASAGAKVAGGLEVSASNLTVTGDISGSGTLKSAGAATLASGLTVLGAPLNASAVVVSASALNVTEDIWARSASLTGDLLVGGNLNVKGNLTYIDSTTVNIGDSNISLATGSTTLTALDGAGLDLGSAAQVQWYYDNDISAWSSNVGVNVATGQKYKIDGAAALEEASTALRLVSGSSGAGQVAVGTILGSAGVLVSGSQKSVVAAPVVQLNGVTQLTASALSVLVGGATTTTASVSATNELQLGTLSTVASYLNGAATSVKGATIVGVTAPIINLSASTLLEVSGATKFADTVSGTVAQFTTVTGSQISGTTVFADTLQAAKKVIPTSPYVEVNAAATVAVDSFSDADYFGAKYIVRAVDQGNGHVQMAELLLAQKGATNSVQMTPYANTYTSGSFLTFAAEYSGDTVEVRITNNSANTIRVTLDKVYFA